MLISQKNLASDLQFIKESRISLTYPNIWTDKVSYDEVILGQRIFAELLAVNL